MAVTISVAVPAVMAISVVVDADASPVVNRYGRARRLDLGLYLCPRLCLCVYACMPVPVPVCLCLCVCVCARVPISVCL